MILVELFLIYHFAKPNKLTIPSISGNNNRADIVSVLLIDIDGIVNE